jgi:UDP-2,3-diacylglucosamine pyrophosphatase LpxH
MKDNVKKIGTILKDCETEGLAEEYVTAQKDISSEGGEVIVVSDFHIASGRNKEGNFSGTENFFADKSFSRFLSRIKNELAGNKAILVINGDFIDFIRIVDIPKTNTDLAEWQNVLSHIGIYESKDELENSITKKEKNYGLKCDDVKSVWKFHRAVQGHKSLFEALAGWLKDGHKIIITKGNHDLEFYFASVRNYLRYALAELNKNEDIEKALKENVLPNLIFVDDDFTIDGEIYLAHGHKYDKFCNPQGEPLINESELNIPFGSFLNRYLINRVELSYPFIDNVRPMENILPLLFKEKFFLGLKFFYKHIPFLFRIIPKRYFRYMFLQFGLFAVGLLLPFILFIFFEWQTVNEWMKSYAANGGGPFASLTTEFISNFLLLFASYFFSKILSYFQLKEPSSLKKNAEKFVYENSQYKFVTFGHTHNPEQFKINETWFFNTGTWIPIVETSSAAIRHDKTYTFLRFTKDEQNQFEAKPLQRWNDEAGRIDKLILVHRKGE